MSWLDKITKEMLANLPKGRFQPVVTFGFADIMAVIAIGERAVKDNYDATLAVHQERAEQAAMDPDHSFIENPVFAPMGAALFTADLTFSLILRRSMFIAICSHVEHVLRTWCSWLEREWTLPKTAKNLKRLPGESDLHHCVRYLRDEAGLSAIDRFETWPEWLKIDACRLARNCLTHNGGVVESAADAATISTLNAVTVDDSGLLHQAPVVHLLEGACEDAATNAKAFFERLTLIAEADPRSPK